MNSICLWYSSLNDSQTSIFICRMNMEDNESQPVEIEKSRDIFLGQIVHNKDEAYDLYQEHGFKMGFSVRKGKELYYI